MSATLFSVSTSALSHSTCHSPSYHVLQSPCTHHERARVLVSLHPFTGDTGEARSALTPNQRTRSSQNHSHSSSTVTGAQKCSTPAPLHSRHRSQAHKALTLKGKLWVTKSRSLLLIGHGCSSAHGTHNNPNHCTVEGICEDTAGA